MTHHRVQNDRANLRTSVVGHHLASQTTTLWPLGRDHAVPFDSFSEFNKAEGGNIWYALYEIRPLACFAGVWTPPERLFGRSRKASHHDLFAFLTIESNAEVGTIHAKAMPSS